MNPLAKALGTVFVLAAGALGTSLDTGFLPDIPGLPTRPASEGAAGNETGNQTADGNQTAGGDGNSTAGDDDGNETADDGQNETADDGGNETAGDDGNETAEDDGNETSDDGDDEAEPEEVASVCDFSVDEWSNDLTPQHHEWEWLVTRDVTRLSVQFSSYGGIPGGLSGQAEARLVDGSGRTIAHATGSDGGGISVSLQRGTDYMASGQWRLVYDSSDVLDDYSVSIHLGCAGEE